MDIKLISRLLTIATIMLLVAGAIFWGIGIFGDKSTNTPLLMAIGCILLSNLFNVIRILYIKKK